MVGCLGDNTSSDKRVLKRMRRITREEVDKTEQVNGGRRFAGPHSPDLLQPMRAAGSPALE